MISFFILPVVIYRYDFHYFMIYMAIGSIPFAYALQFATKKYFSVNVTHGKRFLVLCLLVGLIHYLGIIIFYLNAKFWDINVYSKTYQPYYDALKQIRNDELIAVNGPRELILKALGLCYDTDPPILRETALSFIVSVPNKFEYKNLSKNVRFLINHKEDKVTAISIPSELFP